jgi:hypothetical protein
MTHLKPCSPRLSQKVIALGGLVVACMPLGPRFEGSNQAQDDEFLRSIKVHSTASFEGGGKPSFPCREISDLLKRPTSVK